MDDAVEFLEADDGAIDLGDDVSAELTDDGWLIRVAKDQIRLPKRIPMPAPPTIAENVADKEPPSFGVTHDNGWGI